MLIAYSIRPNKNIVLGDVPCPIKNVISDFGSTYCSHPIAPALYGRAPFTVVSLYMDGDGRGTKDERRQRHRVY